MRAPNNSLHPTTAQKSSPTRRGMNENVISVWEQACCLDPTLNLSARDIPALLRKRVRAVPYSRSRQFSRMAEGRISLFKNLLVPVRGNPSANTPHLLLDGIYN